jgi:hypothetical protein
MKFMTDHVSATMREETPHTDESRANESHVNETPTISDAVRRQAQSVIDNTAIDPDWRAVIRHYLETDDPWVAELLPRAEAGETVIDTLYAPQTLDSSQTLDFPQTREPCDDKSTVEKIEALTEMICGAREESTAALFVLMGTLQNSPQPAMLANAAKHYAFTRCGELNLFGMVDAQIAVVEGELLGSSTVVS